MQTGEKLGRSLLLHSDPVSAASPGTGVQGELSGNSPTPLWSGTHPLSLPWTPSSGLLAGPGPLVLQLGGGGADRTALVWGLAFSSAQLADNTIAISLAYSMHKVNTITTNVRVFPLTRQYIKEKKA